LNFLRNLQDYTYSSLRTVGSGAGNLTFPILNLFQNVFINKNFH